MTTTDEIKQPLLNHIAVPPNRERVHFLESAPLSSQPSTLNSSPKVTCLILAYNEEARIRTALTHALRWADEVVVVDKGSTDRTCEIAREMGARVGGIPFSQQGHERYSDMVAWATHDWVWHFTPGEVPTAGVIAAGRALVGDEFDLVMVPMHYFSFGQHHPQSPWAGGWQPRLYHRKRVEFTGICHSPLRAARVASIEPQASNAYVLHQTHATAESFLRSHADYAINEVTKDTPERVLAQALHQVGYYDRLFAAHPELLGQMIGWKCYWLMVAMHAWARLHPNIPADYATRASEMLAQQWPLPVFATQQADSAQRGEEARAELGTDAGLPAGNNGSISTPPPQ